MRSLLFGIAVALMVTAPATALTSMEITGPGDVSQYTPVAGEVFQITITITTDEPLISWQCDLDDGGKGYTTRVGMSDVAPNNSQFANYGYFDMGSYSWKNDAGWSVVNGLDMTADPDFNGMPLTVGDVYGAAPAGTGVCFTAMITAPTPMVNTTLTASAAEAGDEEATNTLDEVIPLGLPEPASALFLLLGLPFLRRR